MSKISPDDLITEVLNKDPNYVKTKKQKEVDFKDKYKLNTSFNFTLNRLHWFKFRYFIPAFSFLIIIGLSVYGLQSNIYNQNNKALQLSQNSNSPQSAQNESSPNSKIAKAPAPYLPLPESNQNSENLSSNSSSQNQNTNLDPKLDQKDNLNQNPNLTQDNSITNPSSKPLEAKIITNNNESFTFKYDQNMSLLSYDGLVIGSDSCTVFESAELENQNTSFTLKYKLKRTGEICAQIIKEISIEGNLKVKLSDEQIKNFDKLFTIQKNK